MLLHTGVPAPMMEAKPDMTVISLPFLVIICVSALIVLIIITVISVNCRKKQSADLTQNGAYIKLF
jgi:hypothetical protein